MTHSQKKRAENEVIFKQRNETVKSIVKDLQWSGLEADIVLHFTCECSNENCSDAVELTAEKYESARKNSRQFIIKPGHEQPDIEKVIKHSGFSVVEKFEEPPKTDGVLNKT